MWISICCFLVGTGYGWLLHVYSQRLKKEQGDPTQLELDL
jgi:hypothetical protein